MIRRLIIGLCVLFSATALSQVEWGYNIGGSDGETNLDICTDHENNIYVVGRYSGMVDFDPSDEIALDSSVAYNVFIQKMSPGRELIWTKFLKGISLSQEVSITCDDSHLYLTGDFSGTLDFDPGTNSQSITVNHMTDIFLLKLTLNGDFVWVKNIPGQGFSGHTATGISLDNKSNLYISGLFSGVVDFDPGQDTFNIEPYPAGWPTHCDGFVSKFDKDGNFIWVNTVNGPGKNYGIDIDTDEFGFSYFSWESSGSVVLNHTSGSVSLVAEVGKRNVFVSKIDPNGTPVWTKMLDAVDEWYWNRLVQAPSGRLYLSVYNDSLNGLILYKIESNGSIIWERVVQGVYSNSISVDGNENIFITGEFANSVDFDPNEGEYIMSTSSMSDRDIFVLKLSANGDFLSATKFGSLEIETRPILTSSGDGHLYLTAVYRDVPIFDPDFCSLSLPFNGSQDIMVLKIHPNLNGEKSERCDAITYYPNPVTNKFYIHNHFSELLLIELYDTNGNSVLTKNEELGFVAMDLSEFANGVYYVKVKSSICEKEFKIMKY